VSESTVQKASPQAVLCALAAGAALVCVIAPATLESADSGFVYGIVFGTFVGFNVVPTIWSVFGPGSLPLRVSICFSVVFIFFFNFVVGIIIVESSPGSFKDYLQVFGVLPLLFLAAQTPFALMRMVTGWRFRMTPSGRDEQTHRGRQFGIAQLLLVTTFIAFALAMARWSLYEKDSVLPWAAMLVQFGILLFWIAAIGLPCVWTVFRVHHLSISASITAVHAGLLTLAFIVVGLILIRGGGAAEIIPFAIGLHGSTFAVLWSGLALIRYLGYSLGPRQNRSNRFHRNGSAPIEGGEHA